MINKIVEHKGLIYKIGLRNAAFYRGDGGEWLKSTLPSWVIQNAINAEYEKLFNKDQDCKPI